MPVKRASASSRFGEDPATSLWRAGPCAWRSVGSTRPAGRRGRFQGPALATLLVNPLAHGAASPPCPGAVALWPEVASDSGPAAGHSSGLSSPHGCSRPASRVPVRGDGTEAPGGPPGKPTPHSGPCWSEGRSLWGDPGKRKSLSHPLGQEGPGWGAPGWPGPQSREASTGQGRVETPAKH